MGFPYLFDFAHAAVCRGGNSCLRDPSISIDWRKLCYDYAGLIGTLEGTLRFIEIWADNEEVKKAARKGIDAVDDKIFKELL